MIIRLRAQDPDFSAQLQYKLDPTTCEAKNEYGISLRPADYECSSIFNLGLSDGILSITKALDRETAETIHLGVTVEDIASETGSQIAKSKVYL